MARSRQYPPSVDPGAPIEPPVPEGWQRFSFGELLDVVERPVILDADREYQLVNAKRSRGGIAPRERLRGRDIKVKSQFRIEADDFLISKRQIIHGACGIVPKEFAGAVVSNEYVALRPKPSLDINYLRYLSFTPYFQRTCFHSSVGVDVEKMIFKLEQWLQYSVSIPPLPEQRKIAAILSSVDDTFEKAQAVIDQLEVVKKGLLGELLTRGMPGRHKDFKKTKIGDIPVTWRICRLEEIAEVRTGLAKNSKKASDSTVELPYLRVANVQDGHLDLREIKKIQVDSTIVERYLLRDGDVLFNEGGDADKVGRGTVWRGQLPQCLHQNHVFAVRPSKDIHPDFLSLYGGSTRGKAYFLDAAKQTTNLASINSSQLKALPVPLPHIEEQREIVKIAESLNARKEVEEKTLNSLRHLKTALLNSLLSGKLPVSISEQEAA
ncbi:restriction endonuclease subunit S [Archangium violaceum]|uniref:restriction endonuclease subunit S n=1 Tax=Archangium violaceum TaxID=83451 RepID=UPI002B2F854D|nr:restriction endonuclease subunit S [Archangium violaceum]